MASNKDFCWVSFFIRFIFAIVIVFSTYNPEGVSYYHWVIGDLAGFSVLKAFLGVVLLIGWVILIRATLGSRTQLHNRNPAGQCYEHRCFMVAYSPSYQRTGWYR